MKQTLELSHTLELAGPGGRRGSGRGGMRLEIDTDLINDIDLLQLQIQQFERRPFVSYDSKALSDGCSLHLVPPLRKKDSNRYDVLLEDPQGVCYRLTNGRAFLPNEVATSFYHAIRSEEDFSVVCEEYWRVLREATEKQKLQQNP